MVHVMFTKSILPTSWLIRKVTGEDVSHCALFIDNKVVHSTFTGVKIESLEDFLRFNNIEYAVEIEDLTINLSQIEENYLGKRYDFYAFFLLFCRYLLPKWVKKLDLRQVTGTYLCTELISDIVFGEEKLITPYKLYLKLISLAKKD